MERHKLITLALLALACSGFRTGGFGFGAGNFNPGYGPVAATAPPASGSTDIGDIALGAGFEFFDFQAGYKGDSDAPLPDTSNATEWPVWDCGGSCTTPTSFSDIQTQISDASAAFASSPPAGALGYVVSLPGATTFTGTNDQRITLRSNVVLKGAGSGTVVSGTTTGNCAPNTATGYTGKNWGCGFVRANGSVGTSVNTTNSSYPKGLKAFEMTNADATTTGLAVGDVAHVHHMGLDDGGADNCFPTRLWKGNSNQPPFNLGGRVASVVVDSPVSGTTTITLDSGLAADWDLNNGSCSKNVTIQEVTGPNNFGVEDLRIAWNYPAPDNTVKWPVTVNGATDWWFKGVEFAAGSQVHLDLQVAYFGTIVTNKFEQLYCTNTANHWATAGTTYYSNLSASRTQPNCLDYGIQMDASVGHVLMTDNVFDGTTTAVRFYLANTGNVFSHNYLTNWTNMSWAAGGDARDGIKIHAIWSHANLIEGNVLIDSSFQSDQFHGTDGMVWLYRNRMEGTTGETGGIFMRGDFNVSGRGPQDEMVVIGNTATAFFFNESCQYTNLGNCTQVNNGFDKHSNGPAFFGYNIARDPTSAAGKGFILIPETSTDCLGGSCPGTYNIEEVDADPGTGTWGTADVPGSLFFTDVNDWESRTGSVWCSESCSLTDVHDGLGAWGDDFGAALCSIPAGRRANSLGCS